jgi:hypothetical protein
MELNQQQYNTLIAQGLKPTRHNLIGFAENCYDGNNFDELKGFATDHPDETELTAWEFSGSDWRYAQKEALEFAMYCFNEENNEET